jgi:virulence-associated protein VagC
MHRIRLIKTSGSQVLLLLQEYHIPGEEVYISRKGDSIILSPVVMGVQSLWAVLEGFSDPIERSQPEQYDQRSAIDPA